jgi:hypothetical protein
MKQKLVQYFLREIVKKNWDLRALDARLVETLRARHSLPSGISSVDDQPGTPSDRLLDLAAAVIPVARGIQFPTSLFSGRPAPPPWWNLWPGEHYRLLAALVTCLRPRRVIEIGTFTGLSSLAMRPFLEPGSVLTTFDIIPWDRVPGTYLTQADFDKETFVQEIADLGSFEAAQRFSPQLREAGLLFIDAAKDGVLEQNFLDNFEKIGLKRGTILVFDDIRIWAMLRIWRSIRRPKLDFTSFGHWTGTGLLEWDS